MRNLLVIAFFFQTILGFSQSKWSYIYGRNFASFGTTTKVTWIQSTNFKENKEFLSGNQYLGFARNFGSRRFKYEFAAGLSLYKYTSQERIVEERFVPNPFPLTGGYYYTSDSVSNYNSVFLLAPVLRISVGYCISPKYVTKVFASNVTSLGFLGGVSIDRQLGDRAFVGFNLYRQTPFKNIELTSDYGVGFQIGCKLLSKSEKQAYQEVKRSRKEKEKEVEQSIEDYNKLKKSNDKKKKKSTPTIL